MIRQQLKYVSVMFLLGVMTILLYDVFVASRDIKGKKVLSKLFEDLIFWQMCAGVVFYYVYKLNDGIIRGYAAVSFFFGMILFQYAIGKNLTKTLKKIYRRVKIKLHIIFYAKSR